jgi:hypothetical protein
MAGERLNGVLKKYRQRYQKASRMAHSVLLTEFCGLTDYHRIYAIAPLNSREPTAALLSARRRGVSYSEATLKVKEKIWNKAGCPWSAHRDSAETAPT